MRICITILALIANSALADESKSPDPLFQSDTTLYVKITAPLTTLVKERPTVDYMSGVFQYTDSDGTEVNLDLAIRTRGHFRHEYCDFPPLSLNFKKSQTDGTLFDKQNKMKLVVHCGKSDRYEQIVLREFLAYRIFNVVTDLSYRVRLLRVNYVDSEQERDEQVRYAFLIEHQNRFAKRHDRKEVEVERAMLSSLQPDQLNLTSVFEVLIGNTDFSPLQGAPGRMCCHNYVLFGNGDEPIVAVPYDFDQSGFVNAPYAQPNPRFHIGSVRQRLYRGRCLNNDHIPASLQKFRDGHDAIRALIDEQEGMESGMRTRSIRYIDKFYEFIDNPRDVERQIVNNCV